MQKEIVSAIAISLVLMATGIAAAYDFTYSSYTNRPGNFVMNDFAGVTGWNSFQASSLANAGTVDEMTKVTALPVPTFSISCGQHGAPEEKSYQSISMEFYKYGTTVDPFVSETVSSDITVGAANSNIPYINTDTGALVGDATSRYDLFSSTVGGYAGTPQVSNGKLIGVTDDYTRSVFSQIQSYQDDFISATGADSAGTLGWAPTSYTTASLAPETSTASPYVKFNWQDTRGWKPVTGDWDGTWVIQNSIDYQMVQIPFNTQFAGL